MKQLTKEDHEFAAILFTMKVRGEKLQFWQQNKLNMYLKTKKKLEGKK